MKYKETGYTKENFETLVNRVKNEKPVIREFVEVAIPTKWIIEIEDDDSFNELKESVKGVTLVYLNHKWYGKLMSYLFKKANK